MGLEFDREKVFFKEIDLTQDIIKRMASNSFLIKGWTVTLVVATLLLKGQPAQIFIAFIPLLGFWVLDAYFLKQERIFRKIYAWVISNRHESDDLIFDLDPRRFEKAVPSILKTMFSVTLVYFYVTIAISVFMYLGFLIYSSSGMSVAPRFFINGYC